MYIFLYRYGFMMPPKYIKEIGAEMWEGMRVCADLARNTYLGPSRTAKQEKILEARWLENRQLE